MDPHTAQALHDIAAERTRHQVDEGFDAAHDAAHAGGELAAAAGCYALHAGRADADPSHPYGTPPPRWPWAIGWWKPKDRRRDLVRAGALIVAELARLQRAAGESGLRSGGEVTSERIGHIAAIGLQAPEALTPKQIQAVCASALTQRPDRAA
jgi:hypothetical protein